MPATAFVALVILALIIAVVLTAARHSIDRLRAHAGHRRSVCPDAGKHLHLISAAQAIMIVVAVFVPVRAGQAGFIPEESSPLEKHHRAMPP